MKKFLIFLVIVICVVLTISPYLMGKLTEDQYNKQIKFAEEQSGLKFPTRFNRGWFESEAVTTFDFYDFFIARVPEKSQEDLQVLTSIVLKVTNKIKHGPFPFKGIPGYHSTFAPAMAIMEGTITLSLPSELTDDTLELNSYSVIKIDGSDTTILNHKGDSIKFTTPEELTFEYGDIKGLFTFSRNLDKSSSLFETPFFRMITDKVNITLNDIFLQTDYHLGKCGLNLGDSSYAIGKMSTITTEPEKTVVLTELKIASKAEEKEENINGSGNISIKELIIMEQKYGPGEIEYVVSHLDAKTLKRANEIMHEMNKKPVTGDSEENKARMLKYAREVIPGLIKGSPVLEVNKINATTPMGVFNGKIYLSIDGSNGFAFNSLKELVMIAGLIDMKISASLPEKFVKKFIIPDEKGPTAPPSKFPFTKQLIKKGSAYEIEIEYSKGKVLVNGEETQVPGLFGSPR